jgi:DNA-binding MarR family transcriptional regulator
LTDAEVAAAFEELFRSTYLRAVRRVRDKRDRLTPETVAFLDHLAMSGPLTPGELSRHLDRAPSTLSEMLEHLLAKGLLERDRDPADARKSLVWLSEAGREALIEARQVLDHGALARAAAALPEAERAAFLNTFHTFVSGLKGPSHEP